MHNRRTKQPRRRLVVFLLAGMMAAVAGCSGSPVLESSPVARTLRFPAEWRQRAEERKLRKAVEADTFPRANEHGL